MQDPNSAYGGASGPGAAANMGRSDGNATAKTANTARPGRYRARGILYRLLPDGRVQRLAARTGRPLYDVARLPAVAQPVEHTDHPLAPIVFAAFTGRAAHDATSLAMLLVPGGPSRIWKAARTVAAHVLALMVEDGTLEIDEQGWHRIAACPDRAASASPGAPTGVGVVRP
jgi:hypothetical protein